MIHTKQVITERIDGNSDVTVTLCWFENLHYAGTVELAGGAGISVIGHSLMVEDSHFRNCSVSSTTTKATGAAIRAGSSVQLHRVCGLYCQSQNYGQFMYLMGSSTPVTATLIAAAMCPPLPIGAAEVNYFGASVLAVSDFNETDNRRTSYSGGFSLTGTKGGVLRIQLTRVDTTNGMIYGLGSADQFVEQCNIVKCTTVILLCSRNSIGKLDFRQLTVVHCKYTELYMFDDAATITDSFFDSDIGKDKPACIKCRFGVVGTMHAVERLSSRACYIPTQLFSSIRPRIKAPSIDGIAFFLCR